MAGGMDILHNKIKTIEGNHLLCIEKKIPHWSTVDSNSIGKWSMAIACYYLALL